MRDWIATLARLHAQGEPAVVVTVASTRGSAPRAAGTRMIVGRRAVHGTIGGGHLEHQAIAIARDVIAGWPGNAGGLRRFPLGASLGQCCGGVVNLLFEPVVGPASWVDAIDTLRRDHVPCVIVSPTTGAGDTGKLVVTADRAHGTLGTLDAAALAAARDMLDARAGARLLRCGDGAATQLLFFDPLDAPDFDIVLFGAGHVGRALVRALADIPCRVTWVDARAEEFPHDVPSHVTAVHTDAPEDEIDAAPPGSYFLVMTHSHALDEALSEKILKRNDFAYFGLIGSLSKRRQFERRMERRGMARERFAAMTCPIGIAGIPGKEPATIAIAVAAELLQVRARAAAATRSPALTRAQCS